MTLFNGRKLRRKVEDALAACWDEARTLDEKEEVMESMRKWEEVKAKKRRISPDTLLIVFGNIIGILLILSYEHLGVITSKALGFVLRSKL